MIQKWQATTLNRAGHNAEKKQAMIQKWQATTLKRQAAMLKEIY